MSSGKVKCTCGWSWNKSDSSKKDMYVCHECGRDNSNNMKNGGWLDSYADGGTMQEHQENYNDNYVSLPEGFEGDGYNTKGRNYSPAWGGQFEKGGEIPMAQKGKKVKPIYVESKNDPRYRAYQDSLVMYNKSNLEKFKDDSSTHKNKILGSSTKRQGDVKIKNIPFSLLSKNKINKDNYDKTDVGGKLFQDNIYGTPILPYKVAIRDEEFKKNSIRGTNMQFNLPFQKNTINRQLIGLYKKPQQQVVIKNNKPDYTLKEKYDYPISYDGLKEYEKVYNTPQVEGIENKLKPIGIENDFNIQAGVPQIRQQVRLPEYYDVTDRVNQNFGGTETKYRWYPSDGQPLPQISSEVYDDGSPYNSRSMTPRYQMGGSVYPVNYVPQAAMGGSIPGAVGFSYARTQSPAPSNGPYAKKTKASAQKGKAIPKLDVSKLNLTVPKSTGYAWADDMAKKNKKALEKVKEIKTKVDNREIAAIKKQYKVDDATAKKWYDNSKNLKQEQAEVREYTPQSTLSKTWDVITNPMTTFGYVARNQDLPDNFTRGERNNLDMAMDVINPAAWANYGARGLNDLSNVPGQLMEGDFQGAGESTLTGTMNLLGAVPLGQELKAITPAALKTLPKAKNVKDALGTFRGIPTERSLPRLSPEELKAYRQVQEIGRMRATNKPISDQYRYALDQNIPDEHFEKVFGRSKTEVEQILPSVAEQEAVRSSIPIRERFNLERTPRRRSSSDAAIDEMNNQLDIRTASPEEIQQFADSVGMSVDEVTRLAQSTLPQQTRDGVIRHTLTDYGSDADIERLLERTYTSGELRPIPEELIINTQSNRGRTIINSQNPRLNLLETARDDWQRYVDNKVPTSEVINDKFANIVSEYPYYKGPVLENVPSLSLSTSGNLKNVSKKVGDQSVSGISSGDVFTGSLNTSHNSYLPQIKQVFKYNEGTPQFLGYKPMNHLGFLSDFRYSQDDIAKYLNTEIDQQISRGVIPDNIQRPYVTKKDRVILPHYGIKQFKEGGNVIKDDLGQWKHPGQITEINSPYITMKGVPYPVLGISDTGDTQMMYPEEEYEFDGTKVTEFPMAKNGLRQEQKGLVNLDQLTNFTNYNKPQPGGWLNKYN
jgi:hypothetical protein